MKNLIFERKIGEEIRNNVLSLLNLFILLHCIINKDQFKVNNNISISLSNSLLLIESERNEFE